MNLNTKISGTSIGKCIQPIFIKIIIIRPRNFEILTSLALIVDWEEIKKNCLLKITLTIIIPNFVS